MRGLQGHFQVGVPTTNNWSATVASRTQDRIGRWPAVPMACLTGPSRSLRTRASA